MPAEFESDADASTLCIRQAPVFALLRMGIGRGPVMTIFKSMLLTTPILCLAWQRTRPSSHALLLTILSGLDSSTTLLFASQWPIAQLSRGGLWMTTVLIGIFVGLQAHPWVPAELPDRRSPVGAVVP